MKPEKGKSYMLLYSLYQPNVKKAPETCILSAGSELKIDYKSVNEIAQTVVIESINGMITVPWHALGRYIKPKKTATEKKYEALAW